jgi:hypothetical protein
MSPKRYDCAVLRPFSLVTHLHETSNRSPQAFYTREGPIPAQAADRIWKEHGGGFIPSKHFGRRIAFVNGKPVEQYLQEVADAVVAAYKGPQVRFNALLRRDGWPVISTANVASSHITASDLITFDDGETIRVPNIGYCTGDMSPKVSLKEIQRGQAPLLVDVSHLHESRRWIESIHNNINPPQDDQIDTEFTLSLPSLLSPPLVRVWSVIKRLAKPHQIFLQGSPIIDRTAKTLHGVKGLVSDMRLIATMDGNSIYVMCYPRRDVLVFKLKTFNPMPTMSSFMRVIEKLYSTAASRNLKHLIIDVSHNGFVFASA